MCDFFDKFCFILIGGNWFGIVICLRWHLIAGPKAEEDCPSDARDVLLTVSYSRLTLCCCCCCCWLLLLRISLKLPDAVWLCGIFYINVNTIFFIIFFNTKCETWTGARIRCWTKRSMFWSSEKALRRGQNLPFTPSDVSVKPRVVCVKSDFSPETC